MFSAVSFGDFWVLTKARKETKVMLDGEQVALLAEEVFEQSTFIEPYEYESHEKHSILEIVLPKVPERKPNKIEIGANLRPRPDLANSASQSLVMADVYMIKS
jgi:hypothetical protein